MQTNRLQQTGMTLIELLVTLSLAVILLTLAVPGMQTLMANQRVNSATSALQASVLQTRNAALTRNLQAVMQPVDGTNSTNGDFKNGWRIYIDINSDETYDDGSDILIFFHESLPDSVSVAAPAAKMNHMIFSGLGFLESNVASGNATWTVSASATTRTKSLTISPSGRVRVI